MASKKKKQEAPHGFADLEPSGFVGTAQEAIEALRIRGYDQPATLSYAKAAKSWCNRDDAGWQMWSQVIATLSAPVSGSG